MGEKTWIVETRTAVGAFGAKHKRIPPRAWSYKSDVETVHRTIEDEFYDLENFENIRDFHQRVASYQAWYNLFRGNMNKDDMSPWQIIKKLRPKTDLTLARLPPLMLDWLGPDYATREELLLRGYDLPCYPSFNNLAEILAEHVLRIITNGLKNWLFAISDSERLENLSWNTQITEFHTSVDIKM